MHYWQQLGWGLTISVPDLDLEIQMVKEENLSEQNVARENGTMIDRETGVTRINIEQPNVGSEMLSYKAKGLILS